jgi:hypothetical protein
LDSLGRHKEALVLHQGALAFEKEVLPKDHPDIAQSMCNLACSLLHFRRHRPAVALLKEALVIQMQAGFDRHHSDIVDTKYRLQDAKTKNAVLNALKLPKPHARCPFGSGKKYRDCCY